LPSVTGTTDPLVIDDIASFGKRVHPTDRQLQLTVNGLSFTAEALLGWLTWLTWLIWLTGTSMADSLTTLLYPCDLADSPEAGPQILLTLHVTTE
jgi:hypothetical protein